MVRDFERSFASKMGVSHALAVTSGTAALRVALASLGIGPGDEVITQAFTFVATVEAIIEAGATPICVEVDSTLNMSVEHLEKAISPKTRAVIAVHMLGTPARLREIKKVCSENKLFLIEDTAWGCGGFLDDRPLGTWGQIGAYSFDFAKTMTTGEGGMVVFNDEELWLRAAAWHDHGHENNPDVPRWEDTRSGSGFNFRMMELQAAVGLAQLEKLSQVVAAQRYNSDQIWREIRDLPGVEARSTPEGSTETADALVFFVPDREVARSCRVALNEAGFATKILPEAITWHFAGAWSHMPELVSSCPGGLDLAFPKSRSLLERSVSLPISVEMKNDYPREIRKALTDVL